MFSFLLVVRLLFSAHFPHMPTTTAPPTPGLRRAQLEKAAGALLAHAKAQRARGGGQLFDDEDEFVYMVRREEGRVETLVDGGPTRAAAGVQNGRRIGPTASAPAELTPFASSLYPRFCPSKKCRKSRATTSPCACELKFGVLRGGRGATLFTRF